MDEEQLRALGEQIFKTALAEIIQAEEEGDYDKRNTLTVSAMGAALTLGYGAGFKLDEKEPDWPVAYIDLPTGQVSWHIPAYAGTWDGHDNAEKYRRVVSYINA
jgi:hypothetical protein